VCGINSAVTNVTVVIPAWDDYVGPRLLDALESVRGQACPATLLVVDNASRTELPPLGDVELVRLAQRASTGAARNAALDHLITPFVVFLDADDLLLPGALDALTSGIAGTDAVSAYALSIVDDVTGKRHRTPRRVARMLARAPQAFALANTVWSLLPTQGCTIMRVDDVRACGGYGDSSHGEDWVLATSLAFRGRVAFGGRPALRYRQRRDSPGVAALGFGVLLANARRVRARVREDPAVPDWARAVLPLIALAQWSAACVAHPVYRSARALFVRQA
jgi:glycosyltransferase involved in cell wall biosynthesis